MRNLFVRESGNYKTSYKNDMKMFGTTGAKIKMAYYCAYCSSIASHCIQLLDRAYYTMCYCIYWGNWA